jgi:hypothetical protein
VVLRKIENEFKNVKGFKGMKYFVSANLLAKLTKITLQVFCQKLV